MTAASISARATTQPAEFTSAIADRKAASNDSASRWKSIAVTSLHIPGEPSLQPATYKRSANSSVSSGEPAKTKVKLYFFTPHPSQCGTALFIVRATLHCTHDILGVILGTTRRTVHNATTSRTITLRTEQRSPYMSMSTSLAKSPTVLYCVGDCFANVLVRMLACH
jgi:hypothetical protein